MYVNKTTLWVGGLFGFIMASALMFSGCANNKIPMQMVNPTPRIETIQSGLKANAETLTGTTNDIKKNAAEGQKQTPEALMPTLNPFWTGILVSAGIQDSVVKQLQNTDVQLKSALTDVSTLKTQNSSLVEENRKLTDESQVELRHKLYTLIAFGVILLGISAWLMSVNNAWAKGLGVGAGVITISALFIAQTQQYVVYIALPVVALVCVISGIWFYRKFIADNKQLASTVVAVTQQKNEMAAVHKAIQETYEANFNNLNQDKSNLEKKVGSLAQQRDALTTEKTNLLMMAKASSPDNPTVTPAPALESRVKAVEDNISQLSQKAATTDIKVSKLAKKVEVVKAKTDQTKAYLQGMNSVLSSGHRVDPWTAHAE